MTSSTSLLGGIPSHRRSRTSKFLLGGAAVVVLAVAGICVARGTGRGEAGSLLGNARMQQLGPYDTPPVTWYFPGSSYQNNLGYTWNEAQMQTPTVTYGPGVPTSKGIAYTTADTIGYDFGDTTAAYPMGGNAQYQYDTTWAGSNAAQPSDVVYQYDTIANFAKTRRGSGLKGAALRARGISAREQSLVDMGSLDKSLEYEDVGGIVGSLAAKLRAVDGGSKALEAKIALEGAALDKMSKQAKKGDAEVLKSNIMHEQKLLKNLGARRVMKKQITGSDGRKWDVPNDLLGAAKWKGVDYVNTASATAKSNHFEHLDDVVHEGPTAPAPDGPRPPWTYCNYPGCQNNNIFVYGDLNLGVDTRPEELGALGPAWDYTGVTTGPGNWSELNSAWAECAEGTSQSPVNLEINIQVDKDLGMLKWNGPSQPYQAMLVGPLYANVFTLTRLQGHMTVSGLKMNLRNMTLHTPSEHRVAGRGYPGELQFWHEADVDSSGVGLIVSAFLVISDMTSPFLRTTINTVRGFSYTYNPSSATGMGYDLPFYKPDIQPPAWFSTSEAAEGVLGIGSNYANYMTYSGSLSQPPCTEGVTRIILQKPIPITASDLALLSELQGPTARPLQRMNGRAVYESLSHPEGQR